MEAIRLKTPGVDGLRLETVDTPSLELGEALVEVHAAAITRDELEWPLDRLPAVPSYELSGAVVAVADDVDTVSVGDEVYALTPFDRDGVAAEYAAVPAWTLAPKPSTLTHAESAAIPLPALSAWRGCSLMAASSPASGCWSTERLAASASSRLSSRAGAALT